MSQYRAVARWTNLPFCKVGTDGVRIVALVASRASGVRSGTVLLWPSASTTALRLDR